MSERISLFKGVTEDAFIEDLVEMSINRMLLCRDYTESNLTSIGFDKDNDYSIVLGWKETEVGQGDKSFVFGKDPKADRYAIFMKFTHTPADTKFDNYSDYENLIPETEIRISVKETDKIKDLWNQALDWVDNHNKELEELEER